MACNVDCYRVRVGWTGSWVTASWQRCLLLAERESSAKNCYSGVACSHELLRWRAYCWLGYFWLRCTAAGEMSTAPKQQHGWFCSEKLCAKPERDRCCCCWAYVTFTLVYLISWRKRCTALAVSPHCAALQLAMRSTCSDNRNSWHTQFSEMYADNASKPMSLGLRNIIDGRIPCFLCILFTNFSFTLRLTVVC